jgi:hypothetical protein
MSLRRRLRALLMAVLLPVGASTTLLIGTLLSTTTPAFAGSGGGPVGHAQVSSCWDRGCNGGNPQTSGCAASAYTVYHTLYGIYHFTSLFGYVELRYSTGCGSNWSRVTVSYGPAEQVNAGIYNNVGDSPQGNCYWDAWGAYSCMLGGAAESDYADGSINTPNGAGYGKTPWG